MGTYERTMLKLEKMAQKNTAQGQKWQTEMSNTSHQREVKDLVNAGLNPVLSSGGSGAQSYTTSVDSAVNGIAGMASAREGANATRYAAQQSAAATRAAAAAQLEAARISAAASNYAADRHYDTAKYQTDNAKTGSVFGVLDNLMKRENASTIADLKNLKFNVADIHKNPTKYFQANMDQKGMKLSTMNWKGKQVIQKFLRKYDISVSLPNQTVAFNALILGKKNDLRTIQAWISAYDKKANNAVKRASNFKGFL